MPQMTPAQARIVDPVLTTHSKGYKHAAHIWPGLAPQVPVGKRGAKLVTFGKESFRLYSTIRAPGTAIKRIQVGHGADSIALHQDALAGVLPDEINDEASDVPGIDMGRNTVDAVNAAQSLQREYRTAQRVHAAANYPASNHETLTGTDQWSDDDSDPGTQIEDAKLVVANQIGVEPNVLQISRAQLKRLKRHPLIRAQFKYTNTNAKVVTEQMLAEYFEVEKILVGRARYLPEGAPETQGFSGIWADDKAVLAYVPMGSNRMEPAFAYTYELSNMPANMQPWYDRDTLSWIYPMVDEWEVYMVSNIAGYLFEDVLA